MSFLIPRRRFITRAPLVLCAPAIIRRTHAQGGMGPGPGTVHSAGGGGGIALVTHGQIAGALNGGTSGALDTTGATLLVISVAQYNGGTLTGPTDSKSNTWIGLTGQNQTTEAYNRLFYAKNPTVGTGHTFTVANTGIASITQIAAFSGVTTSAPFDVENGAKAFLVSTLATGSVTPAAANSLIVSGTTSNSPTAGAYTINTGFTITDQGAFSAGVNEGGGLAYLVQSGGPTAVNPTWTYPGTPSSIAATIAVFK